MSDQELLFVDYARAAHHVAELERRIQAQGALAETPGIPFRTLAVCDSTVRVLHEEIKVQRKEFNRLHGLIWHPEGVEVEITYDEVVHGPLNAGESRVELKSEDAPFDPDWCVAPGVTLEHWREETDISTEQAARRCGLHQETFVAIENGTLPITPSYATALARGTGIKADFWLKREGDYRRGLKDGKEDVSPGDADEVEGDGDMLARLGTDAEKWTREFIDVLKDTGARLSGDPGDLLHTWFANAIEAGRSAGIGTHSPFEARSAPFYIQMCPVHGGSDVRFEGDLCAACGRTSRDVLVGTIEDRREPDSDRRIRFLVGANYNRRKQDRRS